MKIILAIKPLQNNFSSNVISYSTGGYNIDACRIETKDKAKLARNNKKGLNGCFNPLCGKNNAAIYGEPWGRFPANLILEKNSNIDQNFPYSKSGAMKKIYTYKNSFFSLDKQIGKTKRNYEASEGSANRFFKQI